MIIVILDVLNTVDKFNRSSYGSPEFNYLNRMVQNYRQSNSAESIRFYIRIQIPAISPEEVYFSINIR